MCYRAKFWTYSAPGTALVAGDESVNKTDQNPPGAYIVIARGTMQSAGDGKRKARDPTSSLKKDPCGCLTENRLKTDAGRSGETSEEVPDGGFCICFEGRAHRPAGGTDSG